jgi:hypothetical protein
MLAAFLLAIAGLLLVYALCAIQAFQAFRLIVKVDPMVKNVGDFVKVSVVPVPAEAIVTQVTYFVDPAYFSNTHDDNIFAATAPGVGLTIRVDAIAADGSTVSGTSEPFDVVAPAVVATGLTVTVA